MVFPVPSRSISVTSISSASRVFVKLPTRLGHDDVENLEMFLSPACPEVLRYVPKENLSFEEDACRRYNEAICEADAFVCDGVYLHGRWVVVCKDICKGTVISWRCGVYWASVLLCRGRARTPSGRQTGTLDDTGENTEGHDERAIVPKRKSRLAFPRSKNLKAPGQDEPGHNQRAFLALQLRYFTPHPKPKVCQKAPDSTAKSLCDVRKGFWQL